MFSKLLKHEWRANAGLLGILSLCALGAGLLGGGLLRAIVYVEEHMKDLQMVSLTVSSLSVIMFFLVLALLAYALAVQFIMLFRFYKNKFTDEGYLTFTLPVKASHIFLSSLLVMLAWLAISVLVVLAAGTLIILIGVGEHLPEIGYVFEQLAESLQLMEDFFLPGMGTYAVFSILQVFVSPVYALVLLMTSITLGCILAKKHKILASIGMYYALNTAVGIISSILQVVPSILLITSMDSEELYFIYMATSMGLTLALQVGLALGGYFLSTHLMKNKLNLP